MQLVGYRERQVEASDDRQHPGGSPTLIFNLGAPIGVTDVVGERIEVGTAGEVFYAGLHQSHCYSHSPGRQRGVQVKLTPVEAYALLGPVIGELTNRAVLLSNLDANPLKRAFGKHGPKPEAVVRTARSGAPAVRPELAWAWRQLDQSPGTPIRDLARVLGWSKRRLASRFHEAYGVNPKLAARLLRFESAVDKLRSEGTDAAIDCGY